MARIRSMSNPVPRRRPNLRTILAGPIPSDRPQRRRTLIGVHLEGERIPTQRALVRNVSEDGLCLSTRMFAPDMGDMVRVWLPIGIMLEGEVRWVNASVFGLKLTSRLDVRQLELATQRADERLSGPGADRAMRRL